MPRTPRVVASSDGRMLVDLAAGAYRELVPLTHPELVAAHTGSALDLVRSADGRRAWTRIETPDDGWVLASRTLRFDGSADALRTVHASVDGVALPLDALAAAWLDPKRVRAEAEGVDVAPARSFAVPTLVADRAPSEIHPAPNAPPTRVACWSASSPHGLRGFEVVVRGSARFYPGEHVDESSRRLALELGPRERANVRVRAIDAHGLRSRWTRWLD